MKFIESIVDFNVAVVFFAIVERILGFVHVHVGNRTEKQANSAQLQKYFANNLWLAGSYAT